MNKDGVIKMDEMDIMSTLNSWANEFGKDELKNVYENIFNMESESAADIN